MSSARYHQNVNSLREKAESGSTTAQYELAIKTIDRDSSEAIYWLERAARMKHALAREVLAYLFPEENPHSSDAGPRLRTCMEWLSESCWCAGWIDGLEFELWAALDRPGCKYGLRVLAPVECATLRWLSNQCGGWFMWSESLGEPIFVDLHAWGIVLSKRRTVR